MTLNDLLTDLKSIPKLEDTHLAFLLDGDVFETGYHITELKFAEITGVDCAGRLSNWQEAALQVLDGDGPMEMPYKPTCLSSFRPKMLDSSALRLTRWYRARVASKSNFDEPVRFASRRWHLNRVAARPSTKPLGPFVTS